MLSSDLLAYSQMAKGERQVWSMIFLESQLNGMEVQREAWREIVVDGWVGVDGA